MVSIQSKNIFDYIVVGTGPAGAAIAKTLSDDKKTSVLVLEAGENDDQDKPIRDLHLNFKKNFSQNIFGKEKAYPGRSG